MSIKKIPCPGLVASGQDNKSNNSNVSLDCRSVKSESDNFNYFVNTFTQFALQDEAQNLISSKFPGLRNTNFCKCHRINYSSIVSLKRNPETSRAYYNGVVTCANSFLCPVCAPRIMGIRADEIGQAMKAWFAEDSANTCYMVTLTLRHKLTDSLQDLLELFKDARKYFWGHRTVKHLLSCSGLVGRITATEIRFNIFNGWHPHQHILLFCKRNSFELEVLQNIWLAALASVGLSGIADIAFDLEEARSIDKYLTKLPMEMTLGSLKQGRAQGSYSPFQLLQEASNGAAWAEKRFIELFQATRGIHTLTWSKGLKARFDIGSFSDMEIAENKADAHLLFEFLQMFDMGFRKLSATQKAALRNAAAIGDQDKAKSILQVADIQYSFLTGGVKV